MTHPWAHLRGTWSTAHGIPTPKRPREDRPEVLRRRGDGALAIPALRQGVWYYVTVSREDAWACASNWFVTKNGYTQRNHNKRAEYLHRLVYVRQAYPDEFDVDGIAVGENEPTLEPGSGTVDHHNRRQLDNTRRNLRLLTQSDQNRNQHRNTRKDVGVVWDEAKGRWAARIYHLGRDLTVGRFRSRHAAIARRAEVMRKMGLVEEPVPVDHEPGPVEITEHWRKHVETTAT